MYIHLKVESSQKHSSVGDQNDLGKAASTSNTFKSSIGSEWQNPNIITSDQAAQNGEKIKEEEEYDIDHDHLLLPWACCIPIVLDNFEAKQASYDHYSFSTYSLFYKHYPLELFKYQVVAMKKYFLVNVRQKYLAEKESTI